MMKCIAKKYFFNSNNQIKNLRVCNHDKCDRNAENEYKNSDIVADHAERTHIPLDTAAGLGALERIVRPAEQRHR
jgi:hypothetical protein